MKLRYKKTGDIWDFDGGITMKASYETAKREGSNSGIYTCYAASLAELNRDWEDYKSAEPLIKDEKIRKVVRAWAKANNLNNVAFENYDDENVYFIDGDYEPQIWFSKKSILESPLDDGKIYTIDELCGEEEA